jgi:hypothetical protein
VARYLGDFAAQLDLGDGHRGLVESTLPLRTRDSSGESVPADLELVDHGSSFAPRSPYVKVGLSKRLANGIELLGSGVAVVPPALGDPIGERAGGSVFWGNAGGQDTDIVATPLPWGFQVLGYLRSAESPEAIPLRLRLPIGAVATQDPTSGQIAIVRGDEKLATISPPVAYDADGTQVEASYVLNGSTLIARVAHRSADAHYPVVLDPVVVDNFQHWYTNGAMDATGWENGYYTSDGIDRFNRAFSNGSFGRGLYLQTNDTLVKQDQAYWKFFAPRGLSSVEGSYIYRADFNYVKMQTSNDCLFFGIERNYAWDAKDSYCIDPNYAHFAMCKAPDCSATAGTNSNAATFLMVARYSRATTFTAFLGGAAVYLNDREPPSGVTVIDRGHPDVWLSDTTFTPVFSGYDKGLGVKQFKLTIPGQAPRYRTHACQGDRHDRCPAVASTTDSRVSGDSFAVNTNTVPEGLNTMEARVIDFSGNSVAQTWTLKVDRSVPTVNVTGLSDGQHVSYAFASLVDIQATDPFSGVKSIEILVDGARQEITREQACDAGGCSMSRTWLFAPANYGPGSHTIEIKATDQIGQTRVLTYQVEVADPLGP